MAYYFHKETDYSFSEAESRIREALQKRGFGILSEIDIQATMREKLDKEIAPHKILGACNPHYAYQALQEEEKISTLLPCNITLSENSAGKVEITVMDPVAAFSLIGNDEVKPLATEVKNILQEALEEA